jgi:TolB-like protein/Flp pilus assembly protein TadD
MSTPAKAIFLSYASQDAEAARRICQALRAAGLQVWFDQNELRSGDAWDASIKKQIRECALFVPVISANTQAREEGYFRREWNLAANRTLDMAHDMAFLLPVVIDDTGDTVARVPDKFRDIQWTRLPGGETPQAFAEHVRALLSGNALPATGTGPSSVYAQDTKACSAAAPQIPKSRSKRTWLIAAMLGVLLLAGAGVGLYFRSAGVVPIESIAVLPFINASGNEEADYLSDGMTETLIGSLSQLPKLNVKARSAVFRYKAKEFDLPKIAKELQVQAILTGRIVQRGEDLTLSLELVNTQTDNAVWSETYNRKQADLVTLQSEIAHDVLGKLRAKLSRTDEAKLAKTSTNNPKAYELYLKGKFYTNQFTKAGFRKGLEYFDQAIAIDPNFGLAYNGLAYNYINQDDWYIAPNEAGPKARDAARKALALDETDADAVLALAITTQWYEWDWIAAERMFKRAIELNPNNGEAYVYYVWFLAPLGRHEQALAEAKRAVQIDPYSSLTNFGVGSALVFNHQWDQAIEQLRKAIELDPDYWFHYLYLGRAYEQKGSLAEAIAAFQRALELDRDQAENWSGLGHAYALSGKRVEAQKIIDQLKEMSLHSYIAPYNIAIIYAGLGDKDQAFAWLDRAYAERSYILAVYLPTDARLDHLHDDPRFNNLIRRVGLPLR